MIISGRAADGAVEAIETKENDQVLGVQWHPEFLYDTMPEEFDLFKDFVARATKYAKK